MESAKGMPVIQGRNHHEEGGVNIEFQENGPFM